MTSLNRLLSELRRDGVELWLDGGQLCFRSSNGIVGAKWQDELRARKPEIIAFLQEARRASQQAPPIAAGPRPGRLPLSFSQQRLWCLERLGWVGWSYNSPWALLLEGALNRTALELSLSEVVRRHESLRTRFEVPDEEAAQVIDDAGTFRLRVTDLPGPAGEERDGEVRSVVEAHANRRFDLVSGPLFRAALLPLSEFEHVLLVTVHQIVCDGWSKGILARELSTLYRAFSQGRPAPLPELPLQYPDYALWQRAWLQGEVLESQVQYWKGRLAGAPPSLELPVDRARPAVPSFNGETVPVAVSVELSRSLQELARRQGATLYMVLLAAFQALLSRWSGQKDIVVGTPIPGRTRRETEGSIGLFVSSLPMRADLSGEPTFEELVDQVKETTLGAYAHQELPFAKLVEQLRPAQYLSRLPIFQVVFALYHEPQEVLQLPGLKLRGLGCTPVMAKFDLTLGLAETPEGLRGALQYATDLFDRETIERLARNFQALLAGIVADPGRRCAGRSQ